MLTKGRHFGRTGFLIRRMPTWCGRRLPFFVLHAIQEHTIFSHVVWPPLSRGSTWSRFRSRFSKTLPQYWQGFLSRSKMVARGDFTPFFDRRSENNSTPVPPTGLLYSVVCHISSSGSPCG